MATEAVAKAIIPDDTTKGFATKFLEQYETIEAQLKTANLENEDYRRELTTLDNQIAFLKSEVARVNETKDRYMRYSVELSAQCQFLISGVMRALKIAQSVQMSVASESGGANIPPVGPDTDQAELERIMQSLASKAKPGDVQRPPAEEPTDTKFAISGQQLTAPPDDVIVR